MIAAGIGTLGELQWRMSHGKQTTQGLDFQCPMEVCCIHPLNPPARCHAVNAPGFWPTTRNTGDNALARTESRVEFGWKCSSNSPGHALTVNSALRTLF